MNDSLIGTEFFPNVYFEYVKIPDQSANFDVKLCVFDTLEGTWSKNEDFLNNLELLLFAIEHEKVLDQVRLGTIPNFMGTSRFQVSRLVKNFPMEFVTFQNTGKSYKKYSTVITGDSLRGGASPAISSLFISDDGNHRNPTFYLVAAVGMSKDKLKDNYGLDLSFHKSPTVEDLSVSLEGVGRIKEIGNTESELEGFIVLAPLQTSSISKKSVTISSDRFINYFTGPCRMQPIMKSKEIEFDRKGYVFTEKETGKIWHGPVHRHNNEWMAGSTHSDTPQPLLNLTRVNRNKLIDASTSISNNEIEQYSNTNNQQQTFPNYHQEEIVEDPDGNINNTCILNLHSLMSKESEAGRIMMKNAPEVFMKICENTNINNIEVNRFSTFNSPFYNLLGIKKTSTNFSNPTLIASSNNNHRKIKEKTLLKVSPRKTMSIDPTKITQRAIKKESDAKLITKDLINNSMKIGKIQQIDLTLPKSLRTVNFTDYDISRGKEGTYKYQVKINTKDEPYLYCKKVLHEITMYHKKISNLSQVLEMKNVWRGDHYDSDFLSDFYSQYDMISDTGNLNVAKLKITDSYKDSYLYKSYEKLHEVERLIGVKRPRATRQYKNYLNLFQSSPEKIFILLKYYESCMSQFKKKYSLIDGQNYEKSSSKKRKDRGMIEVKINLDKQYKKEKISPIGINFIFKDKIIDVPRISPSMFLERSNLEVKKFFSLDISRNNEELKSLPKQLRDDFANVEANKYSSFSPSKIFFGGKELDTTEITPESFDTEFFKDLRVAKTLISTFNNDGVPPETEDVDTANLIDSREFLGEQTKFNSIILANINNISKIRRARRAFPLLENKLLSQNRLDLSLQKFEISNPESVIYKKAKNEISKIPMQIKALSLLKTEVTNFDVNKLGFDPLSNPQTQEVFEQNYLNLGSVKVLEGFEMKNGIINLSKPIYSEINSNKLQDLTNKRVLCKIDKISYAGLTSDTSKFNTFDSIFVMEPNNSDSDLLVDGMEVQQTSLGPSSAPQTMYADLGEMQEEPDVAELEFSDLANEIEGDITFVDFRDVVILQNENNAGPLSSLYSMSQYEQSYDLPQVTSDIIPGVSIQTGEEPTTSMGGGVAVRQQESDY